jgi:hypothetical protein
LVFSHAFDQQPLEDVADDIDPDVVLHGTPPIPVSGANVVGAETMGGTKLVAGVIEVLDPATGGIGFCIGLTAIGLTGMGLSPPLPISTEPSGIPAVDPGPADVVDVADDDAAPAVELVPHAPDVGEPGNGIPIVNPPPSYVEGLPDIPEDELAAHVTPLPVSGGLRPADGSSVAPMGIPVWGTNVAPVMPGGEVAPIAGVVVLICATAGPQANIASIEAINAGRILACMVTRQRSAER